MKKILLPIDFTPVSELALEFARNVAAKLGSEIHVLHVVHAPGDTLFDKDGELLECTEYDVTHLRMDAAKAKEQLDRWLSDHHSNVKHEVKIGNYYQTLLKYSKDGGFDMIISGIEHTDGIKENIKGNFTDKFIRKSDIPVLTLKCDRRDFNLQKILLAGDFRSPEKEDLSVMKILQGTYGAEVHLVKVNTPKDFETHRTVHERMQAFANMNELENVHFHVYSDRSVEEGILHFSEDYGMDLLAIGTHARSDFSHLFRGSKAEDVVNHIFKPILTFKI